MPPDIQEKIFAWPDAEGLSPRRQALLTATDEFVMTRTISRDTWDVLSRHLSDRQLIEFCMLAGQYDALSATISALQIPLDYPTRAGVMTTPVAIVTGASSGIGAAAARRSASAGATRCTPRPGASS